MLSLVLPLFLLLLLLVVVVVGVVVGSVVVVVVVSVEEIFRTIWQPDGYALEQMETEINDDDASKSVYLENALNFDTALVFVPIAAADVPPECEAAVILRRLQGPSWGEEP